MFDITREGAGCLGVSLLFAGNSNVRRGALLAFLVGVFFFFRVANLLKKIKSYRGKHKINIYNGNKL